VALLADQLVSRAISHLKNKDKSFDEEAIHEAYRVYGLYSEDIKYVRESDWVLSEKYSDGGVEKFSAGVDKILKSQNSDEDKIKSIKTLSIEFFGYKKPAAQEDYDPKLTIVKVRVDPNLPWFKQAATYKSIFEPLISIPARTNINNLMDILNKRLSENKPVLVKMYWDDKGENRKDGKLRLLRLFMQNYETSDHSVLFYKKDWRGRYYFINSWGKEVGKDGHYTTTASYLKKAISGLEFAVTDKEIQARREAWHP
jgi:hypothetical protein